MNNPDILASAFTVDIALNAAFNEKTALFVDSEILDWVDQNIPEQAEKFQTLNSYHCCDIMRQNFSSQYCFRNFAANGLYFFAHIIEKDKSFFERVIRMAPTQLTRLERSIRKTGYSFGYDVTQWRTIRASALKEIADRRMNGWNGVSAGREASSLTLH